ncbi:MAG: hypothetical protein V2I56_22480 [Desulfobacteraceae bacterium]|jgi:hypothetical protein|nr:hypothetical protein [Desulfobacteraceae bacterium]
MAELHQVIGSILRDITQARITSDIYSRNLSKLYEQDPLLRRFPAPRSEIDEVEIDLKFAISSITYNPSQDENREAMAANIFIKYADHITQTFFDGLIDCLETLQKDKKLGAIDTKTSRKIYGFEHRIYLKQDVLLYFLRHKGNLLQMIKDGGAQKHIKNDILRKRFKKIYRAQLTEKELESTVTFLFQDSMLTEEELNVLAQCVFKEHVDEALKNALQEMKKPLQHVWEKEGDQKLSVEVTAEKLMETPESAISTIKIKSRVQNYMWTKIEHEGKHWRELNPM